MRHPTPRRGRIGTGLARRGAGRAARDRRNLVFSASVVLFHFANAAMLPLAGQKLSHGHDHGAAGYMSACIIAAQLVMVPVALLSSRLAVSWGRRPVFLIGFAILPIRGFLYTMTTSPYALVAIQLLDGIGAGIFGVVGTLVIADLTRGTGRFNLMQGALATATGIGAASSNLMTGFVVKAGGYDVGFLVLAAIAAAALLFYGLAMPETATDPHGDVPASSSRSRPLAAVAVEPNFLKREAGHRREGSGGDTGRFPRHRAEADCRIHGRSPITRRSARPTSCAGGNRVRSALATIGPTDEFGGGWFGLGERDQRRGG